MSNVDTGWREPRRTLTNRRKNEQDNAFKVTSILSRLNSDAPHRLVNVHNKDRCVVQATKTRNREGECHREIPRTASHASASLRPGSIEKQERERRFFWRVDTRYLNTVKNVTLQCGKSPPQPHALTVGCPQLPGPPCAPGETSPQPWLQSKQGRKQHHLRYKAALTPPRSTRFGTRLYTDVASGCDSMSPLSNKVGSKLSINVFGGSAGPGWLASPTRMPRNPHLDRWRRVNAGRRIGWQTGNADLRVGSVTPSWNMQGPSPSLWTDSRRSVSSGPNRVKGWPTSGNASS